MSGHCCGSHRDTAVVKFHASRLSPHGLPGSCPRRPPRIAGRPRSESVEVLGYRYGDGPQAVPEGDVVRRDHLLSVSTGVEVDAPQTPFAPQHGAVGEPTATHPSN
jgi:hypothetical protein